MNVNPNLYIMKCRCIILLLIAFTLLYSCKKDEVEADPVYSDPQELIASCFPENNESGVGIHDRVGLQFIYPVYPRAQHNGGENIKIKVDSAALSTNGQLVYGTDSLQKDALSCYFKENKPFEPITTYILYMKIHIIKWDGSTWYDIMEEGEIKYYEYEIQFQTEMPYNIISNIYPSENATSVPVFHSPYFTTHLSFDSVVTFAFSNQQYRISLQDFKLFNNKVQVSGSYFKGDTMGWFVPEEWLTGGTTLEMEIETQWQKLMDDTWTNCYNLQDERIGEEVRWNFTTSGSNGSLIDDGDIIYTYPVDRQYHFLKSEYDYGYFLFKNAVDNLFLSTVSGINYQFKAIITENKTNTGFSQSIEYVGADKTARFNIPRELKNETIYKLELVQISDGQDTTVLKTIHFRTSKFDDFETKIDDLFKYGAGDLRCQTRGVDEPNNGEIMGYLFDKVSQNERIECFDKAEAQIDPDTKEQLGIARLEVILDDNEFYLSKIYPLVYAPWGDEPFMPVLQRDEHPFGIPPIHAAYIYQPNYTNYNYKILTDAEIENNNAPGTLFEEDEYINFIFRNQIFYIHDLQDLRQQIAEQYVGEPITNERLAMVVAARIGWYDEGYYQFKIKYVLPCMNKVTSEVRFTLEFLLL